jgi:Leucine-rich repeat (LRR) protein
MKRLILAITLAAIMIINSAVPAAAQGKVDDTPDSSSVSLIEIPVIHPVVLLNVEETITVSDSPEVLPAVILAVEENVGVSDTLLVLPPVTLSIDENIGVSDSTGTDLLDAVVIFPDSNLQMAINAALGQASDAPIYQYQLDLYLIHLNADDRNINSLTGLENCHSLRTLSLRENHISDISALSGLVGLQELDLGDYYDAGSEWPYIDEYGIWNFPSTYHYNTVSNLNPLKDLTNLVSLNLAENEISDIGPLSSLNLRSLILDNNYVIAGLDVLQSMPLEQLSIDNTRLKDTSCFLYAYDPNYIWGISNIDFISNIETLKYLNLTWNQISVLPDDLSGWTSLERLLLNYNLLTDFSQISGLDTLQELSLQGNQISSLPDSLNLPELTTLDLSVNYITSLPDTLTIPELTSLELDSNQIAKISGLSGLNKLTYLNLSSNFISTLPDSLSLPELTVLDLEYNQIDDISGLSGLLKLQELHLYFNQITSIPDSLVLPELADLFLGHNPIQSVSGIKDLAKLRSLFLEYCDINTVPEFPESNLKTLSLYYNQIQEIPDLSNLHQLNSLNVKHNQVTKISKLSSVPSLLHLSLADNAIDNIDALSTLNNLDLLDLENNEISDISSLVSNNGLGTHDTVYLSYNYLDITPGSFDMAQIQILEGRVDIFSYLPQNPLNNSLSVNISGQGSVSRSPDQPLYGQNEKVTMTAVPGFGWHFVDWGGDLTGSDNPATITMDGNKSVTANFEEDAINQTWFLDGIYHPSCMGSWTLEKGGVQNGSITLNSGDTYLLSSVPADQTVAFYDGTWKLHLDTGSLEGLSFIAGSFTDDPWSSPVDNFHSFSPVGAYYQDGDYICIHLATDDIQAGDYLALKITNDGSSRNVNCNEGASYLKSPDSNPAFSVPELSAGLLLVLGLAGLGGWLITRRRKAGSPVL